MALERPAVTVPSPERLDTGWLTAVLRDGGALPRGRVTSFSAKEIGRDHGFTGTSLRVVPRYDPPSSGPASFVAKFPFQGSVAQSVRRRLETEAGRRASYETARREMRFLRELAAGRDLPVSLLLGCALDEASGLTVLLLEDLSDARGGDVLRGCSAAEAESAVAAIARVHGAFAGRPADAFPSWLPRWRGIAAPSREQAERFRARPGVPTAAAAVATRLPEGLPPLVDALERAPFTLIHGDLHLDNVLFRDDGARLLDWQACRLGPAALDFACLVFDALDAAARRPVEDDLLRLGYAGTATPGYDAETWRADVARALAYHFGCVVRWLAETDPAAHEGRERAVLEALLTSPCLAAALEDWGVLELLA